jgi:hypothetical protein
MQGRLSDKPVDPRSLEITVGNDAAGLSETIQLEWIRQRVGFVGFSSYVNSRRVQKRVRMLDFCWISQPFEHTFAYGRSSKRAVDQVFRFVGGDGFEPPTPAL